MAALIPVFHLLLELSWGRFLYLILKKGRWASSPVPEPFCASARSCAWIPTLDSCCLGWHWESVSLQYHVGGLDLIPSAVFSFPQAGRGWECHTDSAACLQWTPFPAPAFCFLGCAKAACEIVQGEGWSLEI